MDKRGRRLDSFQAQGGVPRFFLYGEPPRDVAEGFVHVESIAERSRLYDWRIRPHAHRDLNQLLLVLGGHGEMEVEGRRQAFHAPALLVVPAPIVHAFDFERDTRGYVITVAEVSLRGLQRREPAFQPIFNCARCVDLGAASRTAEELESAVQLLRRETVRESLAQASAAEAHLTLILVGAARALAQRDVQASLQRGPRAALVTRFRDLLDEQFRSGWPLQRYARELCVSAAQLRAACLDIAGKPPMRLVHERLVLEAKRSLTYTDMTIAQIGYDLGFSDPAYFSRFFTEHAGESPSAFRRRASCLAGGARSALED